MKILVINSGSSSIKFTLFEMEKERQLAHGLAEKIGLEDSSFHYIADGRDPLKIKVKNLDYKRALSMLIEYLQDAEVGVIGDLGEIDAVGHRVVHGGEHVKEPVIINGEMKKVIRKCFELAPLHNPPNYKGILAAEELMPDVPQVGVFDTAFFQSIPEQAFLYAIPYEMYQREGVRRYGFHGTSHKYVSIKAAEILGRSPESLKMITCHLGNGCSISAINGEKPVDTSMGLTPLEGLVMGTRSGDLDPAVVIYLMEKEHLSAEEIYRILNQKSGLLGVSGLTSDFRDLLEAADNGNERARVAMKLFTYRLKKYIGSYYAVLGGLDVLVFTAGIGENSSRLREEVCIGLECIGLHLDPAANEKGELLICTEESPVKIMVIPANEELMIARDTLQVITENAMRR